MKSIKLRMIVVCLFVGCALPLGVSAQSATSESPVLSWGIVPQQSAKRLAKLWSPILRHLSQQTGIKLRFKTAKNIPTFEQRVLDGAYDIAYMNPYHYTVFHKSPGYEAFAKQSNKRIQGIVVVRKDSSWQAVDQVDSHTLAFPSPAAFAASVLPRAYFQNQAWAITPKYVSSHDSVYRNVAQGLFPAGGGIVRTFNNLAPEIRDQLRILWKTEKYTPHAFAAHPRVPAEVVDRIQQAIIAMNTTETGQALLKTINFKGVESATDGDWDDVRALNIQTLKDIENP